ncbi:MAG: efflux RND transporter periplasmic adaptor subunit [Phycisphaerae bacterium]|nr:efflux RND transporter periplasmic adaptor subunit [Phycisphaerae bacterium]
MKYKNRWFAHTFWVCAFLSCTLSAGESDPGITAISIPSADVTMSFVKAGIIEKVLVKEGDEVTEKQMLVQQDTETAEANLAQKKIDLQRLEWAAERGSATELEVEHARLDVKVLEILIDDMTLKSPISGTVDKVEVEVGEAANGLEAVIRVVKTDPLWIDVPIPLAQGRTFKKGQPASVAFPGSKKQANGTIIYVSTVADAASSTLRVRIEVPNKQKRPAGEHVQVSFPKTAEPSKENSVK